MYWYIVYAHQKLKQVVEREFNELQLHFNYHFFTVNWATYFSKEAVMERLKKAGKEAAKQLAGNLVEEALKALGLPEVCSS